MNVFTLKINTIPGTRYADVYKIAYKYYNVNSAHTKRTPYIRSKYFHKEKIFLPLFWEHLRTKKNLRDKTRRLKFFICAINLIKNSQNEPISKRNPNRSSEILHRFYGKTSSNKIFCVQIKEDKSGKKWLMSVFPQ